MNQIIKKPWGREHLAFQNEEVAIWVLEIQQGHATSLHAHPHKNTALVVLRGEVELHFIRGQPIRFRGLDKINVFRGRFHQTQAVTNATLLEVETGDKQDILRLEDKYGRKDAPLESETEQSNSCFRLDKSIESTFAECQMKIVGPTSSALLEQDERTVFIVLRGGLAGGLLPPGDAIDGYTMRLLAQRFPPLPKSEFLMIWKMDVP